MKAKKLTPRETEILQLADAGKSSKMVADILAISKRTVDALRCNIYRKLQVNNILEAVHTARDLKLIEEKNNFTENQN